MASRREDAAIGYAMERGQPPFPKHPSVVFGTAEGEILVRDELEIHFKGVTGELAFCKAFDIYYPNRLRESRYSYVEDNPVWNGEPKDADVEDDIEIRSVGLNAKNVCIKKNDNPSFNVVVVRRLSEDCSRHEILGFHPVSDAKTEEWHSNDWCVGYKLPLAELRPIDDLPFKGQTLASYEARKAEGSAVSGEGSPYYSSLVVNGAIDLNDCAVEFSDSL